MFSAKGKSCAPAPHPDPYVAAHLIAKGYAYRLNSRSGLLCRWLRVSSGFVARGITDLRLGPAVWDSLRCRLGRFRGTALRSRPTEWPAGGSHRILCAVQFGRRGRGGRSHFPGLPGRLRPSAGVGPARSPPTPERSPGAQRCRPGAGRCLSADPIRSTGPRSGSACASEWWRSQRRNCPSHADQRKHAGPNRGDRRRGRRGRCSGIPDGCSVERQHEGRSRGVTHRAADAFLSRSHRRSGYPGADFHPSDLPVAGPWRCTVAPPNNALQRTPSPVWAASRNCASDLDSHPCATCGDGHGLRVRGAGGRDGAPGRDQPAPAPLCR